MVRPRWHDALIIAGIVALLVAGVWALWADEVRRVLGIDPDEKTATTPRGQT